MRRAPSLEAGGAEQAYEGLSIRGLAGSLGRQAREFRWLITAMYVPALLLFGVLGAIQISTGYNAGNFTRDPLAVLGRPMYIGSVSTLGILIWSIGAVSCIMGYLILRHTYINRKDLYFILAGGLITTMLLLDDVYLLHENLLPKIGIHEIIVYSSYFLIVAGFLYTFRQNILRSHFLFLAVALTGFALSIGWDMLAGRYVAHNLYILEDAPKFMGIVGWTAFFTLTVYRYFMHSIQTGKMVFRPGSAAD